MSASPMDPDRTLTRICASIQCYNAYRAGTAFPGDPSKYITAPPGTSYVDYWEGQDVFWDGPIEPLVLFGLIFEYTESPGHYLFAFRGTKGIAEWLDDLDIAEEPFRPFADEPSVPIPGNVAVEDGFWAIYASMQEPLFAKLDALGPERVEITGHSLGSALATLFTLDLILSRPGQAFVSQNFASPRVGNAAWAAFYDSLTSAKGNPTTRVVNTKDLVPMVPPEFAGYAHIGQAYDICFESSVGVLPDFGLRHSADNYFQVLAEKLGVRCDCRLEDPPSKNLESC